MMDCGIAGDRLREVTLMEAELLWRDALYYRNAAATDGRAMMEHDYKRDKALTKLRASL